MRHGEPRYAKVEEEIAARLEPHPDDTMLRTASGPESETEKVGGVQQGGVVPPEGCRFEVAGKSA